MKKSKFLCLVLALCLLCTAVLGCNPQGVKDGPILFENITTYPHDFQPQRPDKGLYEIDNSEYDYDYIVKHLNFATSLEDLDAIWANWHNVLCHDSTRLHSLENCYLNKAFASTYGYFETFFEHSAVITVLIEDYGICTFFDRVERQGERLIVFASYFDDASLGGGRLL